MQYIHWNKRPYIHAGAVRRKDIFIWFITLFRLIHEQLASWDRREWGRLVLSSVTLYSMILRNRERVAKRGQEREREKRNWVVLLFFCGHAPMPQISKSVNWTQQRHTWVVSYTDHSQCKIRKERRGFKWKWSGDRVLSQDPLYDKLYIMQYGKKL